MKLKPHYSKVKVLSHLFRLSKILRNDKIIEQCGLKMHKCVLRIGGITKRTAAVGLKMRNFNTTYSPRAKSPNNSLATFFSKNVEIL